MRALFRLLIGNTTTHYQTKRKQGLKVAKTVNACSKSDINDWYKYISNESNKFITK